MSDYVQPRPDRQWPRYEVFKQDRLDKPHQAVGTVHAADPAHALLSARNLFVRRPAAVSLWVVAAEAILRRTAEELAADPAWLSAPDDDTGEAIPYFIFCKQSQRRSMTFVEHIGEVEACSAREALRAAVDRFGTADAWVWWVVPAGAIQRSDDEDIESWFAPAVDKTYRNQSSYGFVSARRPSRRATLLEADDDAE